MGGDSGRVVRVKVTGCKGGDGGGLVSEDGGTVNKSSCKRGSGVRAGHLELAHVIVCARGAA